MLKEAHGIKFDEEEEEIEEVEGPIADIANLIMGISDNAFKKQLKNIQKCTKNGGTILVDVDKIVDDFKDKSTTAMIDALAKVGDILLHIPGAISTCTQVPKDVTKELNYLKKTFSDKIRAMVIIGNVLSKYSKNIVHNVQDFPVQIKQKHNFYKGGKDLGDIVYFMLKEAHAAKA